MPTNTHWLLPSVEVPKPSAHLHLPDVDSKKCQPNVLTSFWRQFFPFLPSFALQISRLEGKGTGYRALRILPLNSHWSLNLLGSQEKVLKGRIDRSRRTENQREKSPRNLLVCKATGNSNFWFFLFPLHLPSPLQCRNLLLSFLGNLLCFLLWHVWSSSSSKLLILRTFPFFIAGKEMKMECEAQRFWTKSQSLNGIYLSNGTHWLPTSPWAIGLFQWRLNCLRHKCRSSQIWIKLVIKLRREMSGLSSSLCFSFSLKKCDFFVYTCMYTHLYFKVILCQ